MPAGGWRDAAPAAIEQGQPGHRLHAAQPRRGRGQSEACLLGAARDAAGFDDVEEQAQVGQVETHRDSVYQPSDYPKADRATSALPFRVTAGAMAP
jgi:hypothetical protein